MVSVADNAFGADLMEDEGRQRTEAIRVRMEDAGRSSGARIARD